MRMLGNLSRGLSDGSHWTRETRRTLHHVIRRVRLSRRSRRAKTGRRDPTLRGSHRASRVAIGRVLVAVIHSRGNSRGRARRRWGRPTAPGNGKTDFCRQSTARPHRGTNNSGRASRYLSMHEGEGRRANNRSSILRS